MDQETTPGNPLSNLLLGFAGAAAGGVIGYFAFQWIIRQGFYPLALPGALLGLGCGVLVRRRSLTLGFACGLLALALGTFVEWRFRPFTADGGLGYFLAHFLDLQPITLLMIALGGFCGFWFALGWRRKPRSDSP